MKVRVFNFFLFPLYLSQNFLPLAERILKSGLNIIW